MNIVKTIIKNKIEVYAFPTVSMHVPNLKYNFCKQQFLDLLSGENKGYVNMRGIWLQ